MIASSEEVQTVAAARRLQDVSSCFVGVGRPSTAAILARRVHNPNLVIIYESGTIGAKPAKVPLSIGDYELAATADAVVSVPEMFNYWVQGERIETAFLGAAQIDRFANLNSTVIGDYSSPRTRLPGAGGAPEIAAGCQEVMAIAPHSRRTFVEHLDFVTTVGQGTGAGSRAELGLRGAGPVCVITDLGILEPHGLSGELTLTAVHPGVTPNRASEATGWTLEVADDIAETQLPTAEELKALRGLLAQ
jgi:glutaconate CoA-transferase, subunit B